MRVREGEGERTREEAYSNNMESTGDAMAQYNNRVNERVEDE